MIIALGHKKQVGKDTFYKIASQKYPELNFKRLSFGDSLKNEVYDNFFAKHGFDKSIMLDESIKPKLRPLLQSWGELKRNFVKDSYWLDQVINQINPDQNYIITDVRYLNEFNALKNANAYMIKISRQTFLETDNHQSEIELDLLSDTAFYKTIDNNDSLLQYEQTVCDIVDSIIRI